MRRRKPEAPKPEPPHPDTTLWEFQQATRAYAQLLEQPYPANNLDTRLEAALRINRAQRAHLEAWRAELPKERARQAELEERRRQQESTT